MTEAQWDQAFGTFCSQFDKTYLTAEEHNLRKNIFKTNVKKIQEYNRDIQRKIDESGGMLSESDFVILAINEFAD